MFAVLLNPDGSPAGAQLLNEGEEPTNPDGLELVWCEAAPMPWQRWQGGAFVDGDSDAIERHIDAGHCADYGDFAIAFAHYIKELEARLCLAGTLLPGGVLEAEAAATGQDAAALAQIIVDRAAENHAAEVARIVAKRAVRAEQA